MRWRDHGWTSDKVDGTDVRCRRIRSVKLRLDANAIAAAVIANEYSYVYGSPYQQAAPGVGGSVVGLSPKVRGRTWGLG